MILHAKPVSVYRVAGSIPGDAPIGLKSKQNLQTSCPDRKKRKKKKPHKGSEVRSHALTNPHKTASRTLTRGGETKKKVCF